MTTVEKFYVIDGRHRLWAAQTVGVPEMRVDVHHAGGFGLRVVPIDALEIDPDVQFEDTFKPHHARRIAREWDPEKVGVLLAVTSDVTAARKAELKMGRDDARRSVGTVERFRARVLQGDQQAVEVDAIVHRHGWKIAGNGKPGSGALAGVVTIERLYEQLGAGGLDRVMALADQWRGEAQAGVSAWIGALGLLVRDGYDENLSDEQRGRMVEIVPALIIRKAVGNVAARNGIVKPSAGAGAVTHEVASLVRKALKLRKRPSVVVHPQGQNVRPVA